MKTLPLWFLAAGRPFSHTLEMLQSLRLSALVSHLASTFDWVIIDSPPLAPLADATIWANLADATLLVVRLKRTPAKVFSKVLDSIDKRKLLGVVLNDCTDRHLSYYAQYYKKMLPDKDSHRNRVTPAIRDASPSPQKSRLTK
jgi:Mrp family chromosome partitioning ATPase